MNMTTTDLSDFGYRELSKARDILDTWMDTGLPEEFYDDNVQIMFNTYSGEVFLTNDNLQVAMLNGDRLKMFYTCPECGMEGFKDELLEKGNECCVEYINQWEV